MGREDNLTVAEWRELCEGMTQKNDGFRRKMSELVPDVKPENVLSDLELAQNRLTYAMMGIHPIYEREIELSGFINYPDRSLALYADNGERIVPFKELDPSYVEFLENQKRYNKVKDVQPLSSVAVKVSEELYPETEKHLEPVPMNTDGVKPSCSTKALQLAWARSTILMNHLHEELVASGAAAAYHVSRDDLRCYCESNIGSAQFDRSVTELSEVANVAQGMDGLTKQA